MAIITPNVQGSYHPMQSPQVNVTDEMLKAFLQGSKQGSDRSTHLAGIQAQGQNEQANTTLKDVLQGKAQDATVQKAQDLKSQYDKANPGHKLNVSVGADSAAISETEPNLMNQSATQAKNLSLLSDKTYKPIHDQLDSARGTLDALNQKNAASDKLALINEARLAAGAGGSRAIASIMKSLTGGKSIGSDAQSVENYFNNTPNVPTLQPAQRDALRESVYGRLDQVDQMHQNAAKSLGVMGTQMAPMSDYKAIIGTNVGQADQKLQALRKQSADYSAQKAKMQGGAVSDPSIADPNPSTIDKLKGLFTGGGAPAASSGPHGPAVTQGGVTYKWNPQTNNYE